MFSGTVVGSANAFAAGWANTGAGVTQLLMPLIYSSLLYLPHVSTSTAWRLSFIVPAVFQTITGILVLAFGYDNKNKNQYPRTTPLNSINPKESHENALKVVFRGLGDYRGWILGLLYGFSFGVEMTTDNIIAEYFYDRFGVNLQSAGTIAACFGMTNFFARPMGGFVSDKMGKRFGVRGRLWSLWIVQTVAGLLCVLLGQVKSLWSSIFFLCCFSAFLQAAFCLIFCVVPFVS
jgi:NNP family nitrate/nitrite transporter-like MFS transporter